MKSWQAYAEILGYADERAMLEDMYRQAQSVPRVARKLGYHHNTVRRRMKILGIILRGAGRPRRRTKETNAINTGSIAGIGQSGAGAPKGA